MATGTTGGRLRAQAGLDVVARQLATAYPDANSDRGMRLFPLWRQPSGGTAQLLPVMAVLGGVVAAFCEAAGAEGGRGFGHEHRQ